MNVQARKKRVREAVSYLQNYIGTYHNQEFYEDYSDETIINDVLYGLGVALYGESARFAMGSLWFKQKVLLPHLQRDLQLWTPTTSGKEQQ